MAMQRHLLVYSLLVCPVVAIIEPRRLHSGLRRARQATNITCSGKNGNLIPEGAPTDCWRDYGQGSSYCMDLCGCHRDEVPLTVAMYTQGRSA